MGWGQLRIVVRSKSQWGDRRGSRGRRGKGQGLWQVGSREHVAFHVNGAPWGSVPGGTDPTQLGPDTPSPAPSPGLPGESLPLWHNEGPRL